jgi:hypothetical protein
MDINDSGFNPFDQQETKAKSAPSKSKSKRNTRVLEDMDDKIAEKLDTAVVDKILDDDAKLKQEVAQACTNYFNSKVFGPYLLKDCGFAAEAKKLHKLDLDELKQLRKRLQTAVALRSSGKATKTVALKTIQALEMALQPTPAQCPGTAAVLEQSSEFDEIIEELRLEMSLGVMSAKTRLALLVIQTAYTQNVVAREVAKDPDRYKKLMELAREANATPAK